jgi:cytoskeleton protein RodZ
MTSIGDTLRRERLRRGWNLEPIAAETKIGVHLLQAIEADQFDRLPGGVFALNFTRQYARLLGLDEEDIIHAFRQQFEEPAVLPPKREPPRSSIHLPRLPALDDFRERVRSDSSLSAFVWLVIVMLACAGVYSFWQRARHAPGLVRTAVAEPKPTRRVSEPRGATPGVSPAPARETQKTDFRPAEVSNTGTIRVPARTAPERPAALPATADADKGVSDSPLRVAFTASEPVWVSIKSDGTHAYTGTFEGQRRFDAARKMTVLVGNAGSLAVSLNGNPVGPIGPRGEIRLLVLTPEGAHVVPRTPPTSRPTSEDSEPTAPATDTERP